MVRVAIIGAGIVGSAIAYELSRVRGLEVIVLEKNPAHEWGATGAALGVLLGGLSQKRSGKHLQLRQASLKRWDSLVSELEAITGQPLPYNRHGILELCFDPQAWTKWQGIQPDRQAQGFPLVLWSVAEVQARYPEVAIEGLVRGVFSAQDRQIAPIPVTQELRQAAQQQGAQFYFQAQLDPLVATSGRVMQLSWQNQVDQQSQEIDVLVIAAGLGSTSLTAALSEKIQLQPVLGQAIHYRCITPITQNWPVIQGQDIHLVPVLSSFQASPEFWVGATVEFPADTLAPEQLDPTRLLHLQAQALEMFPFLAQAEVITTWSGMRPRPVNRPAPIIEPLANYENVYLATGHYRNGILLAPITAQLIATEITQILQP
ncbi:FAD-binding oxidoreductase [Synechococcus sp. PCC 6312]|uniref:NAD(P)/FAD-dependent oxidoreductase n=1 Tax=Synechococcus sp. (strain ATCC 27167 / PCC 6312) TaxID=195253 RepID=UPI00029F431B|nr:FAD-dependent oxidoreductase [Synechococcus sp. PCC 6312]AFY62148.1 glycine/D-amino acid oxidase, deaminating [Synechococcus sp. PCC 6312]